MPSTKKHPLLRVGSSELRGTRIVYRLYCEKFAVQSSFRMSLVEHLGLRPVSGGCRRCVSRHFDFNAEPEFNDRLALIQPAQC